MDFPLFQFKDPRVKKRSTFATTEHETISGMVQTTCWSGIPTLEWDVTLPVLRQNVALAGAWGSLSERAVLEWFWNQHYGSHGRFNFTDPHTGQVYVCSFKENSLVIAPRTGLDPLTGQPRPDTIFMASFTIRQRK